MFLANAALTPRARLRLARLIVVDGWPSAVAAKMFMVSPGTVRKWAARLRSEGPAGMSDRSSRPRSMPTKTPPSTVKRILKARWCRRLGPVQIGGELGLPASTVHAVLVRCRINRLSAIDRVTEEPIRRYEHDHPGSLIHVDVTKLGNIPDGGGWRFVERVLSDNGSAYKPHAWRDACKELGITAKKTRPYRPQTNGKIEQFHRTLADGWADAKLPPSETTRREAPPGCLHFYDHHRHRSAIGAPPISRIENNLPGHHS